MSLSNELSLSPLFKTKGPVHKIHAQGEGVGRVEEVVSLSLASALSQLRTTWVGSIGLASYQGLLGLSYPQLPAFGPALTTCTACHLHGTVPLTCYLPVIFLCGRQTWGAITWLS